MNRKKFFYLLLCSLTLILAWGVGRNYFLPAVGSFLVVKDELSPADVIVVCAGDVERVNQAVHLYKEGLSKFIIMSGGTRDPSINYAEWMKLQAVKAGVPEDKILLEPNARHTYQHPVFVKPIMAAHGFTSAIVVSSPYHMRRVAMLFDRAFHGTGIKVIYYPVKNSGFDVENWWQSKEGRRIVFAEYGKMAVNFFGTGVNDFICALIEKPKAPRSATEGSAKRKGKTADKRDDTRCLRVGGQS
jgi:uncharacterized SAM-binding protein YcdF (DUF218 family)